MLAVKRCWLSNPSDFELSCGICALPQDLQGSRRVFPHALLVRILERFFPARKGHTSMPEVLLDVDEAVHLAKPVALRAHYDTREFPMKNMNNALAGAIFSTYCAFIASKSHRRTGLSAPPLPSPTSSFVRDKTTGYTTATLPICAWRRTDFTGAEKRTTRSGFCWLTRLSKTRRRLKIWHRTRGFANTPCARCTSQSSLR